MKGRLFDEKWARQSSRISDQLSSKNEGARALIIYISSFPDGRAPPVLDGSGETGDARERGGMGRANRAAPPKFSWCLPYHFAVTDLPATPEESSGFLLCRIAGRGWVTVLAPVRHKYFTHAWFEVLY